MTYFGVSSDWLVVLSAVTIVGCCVVVHYEALTLCSRYLPVLSQRRRPRVVILICVALVAHMAEIWLFAAGYYWLASGESFGRLIGLPAASLADYAYFSAMTYTTVGFGDVVPTGPIRFLAGIEALSGLVMITWTASYTFLEMQRDWPLR